MAKKAFSFTYNKVRKDKESTKNKTLSLKKKEILIGHEVKKKRQTSTFLLRSLRGWYRTYLRKFRGPTPRQKDRINALQS